MYFVQMEFCPQAIDREAPTLGWDDEEEEFTNDPFASLFDDLNDIPYDIIENKALEVSGGVSHRVVVYENTSDSKDIPDLRNGAGGYSPVRTIPNEI